MIDPTFLGSITALLGANDTCPTTVAGWVWYCDEHDTHGNADSEEEAWTVADAHADFMTMQDTCTDGECDALCDHEICDLAVVPRLSTDRQQDGDGSDG